MRPRPLRASTLARVPRETMTALTLERAPHGGPEVAIVIAELPLEIGFFACGDAVADDNKSRHEERDGPKAGDGKGDPGEPHRCVQRIA